MTALIFDFGNVVNRWEPELALRDLYGSAALAGEAMERLGFMDWVAKVLDAGEDVEASLSQLRSIDPARHQMLAHYMHNIARAHASPVPGTADLIERLLDRGHAVFGMTNAGMAAFAALMAAFPVIARMEDVFVSAREGCAKPDLAAFERLVSRNALDPASCIFVDDKPANVAAAAAAGMEGLLFTSAAALERDLSKRGLL